MRLSGVVLRPTAAGPPRRFLAKESADFWANSGRILRQIPAKALISLLFF